MKIKTSELSGAALDYVVAKALGYTVIDGLYAKPSVLLPGMSRWVAVPKYGTDWSQGGPIIDREDITWSMQMLPEHGDATRFCAFSYRVGSSKAQVGPTKLIAAMRCFVDSKLGNIVDIPKELV